MHAAELLGEVGPRHNGFGERSEAAEHIECDEGADRQEHRDFHHRLRGDGQHQALLMLGGVGVAGAEQDGESGHDEGDEQADVADGQAGEGRGLVGAEGQQQRGHRLRHGLELQGDVGHDAGHRDDGDKGGDGGALAVAGADEVGDGGDVLGFAEADDAADERQAESEHQDGADVYGQEVEAAGCRQADAAEEGPRRAVDRQRQGVDVGPRARALAAARLDVAVIGHREQEADVYERGRDDFPGIQHGCRLTLYLICGKSAAIERRRLWHAAPKTQFFARIR